MSKDARECDQGVFTFDTWKKLVDSYLTKSVVGLPSDCLVDVSYWSMWDLGAEPVEAAQEALFAEFGSRAPVLAEYAELHGE